MLLKKITVVSDLAHFKIPITSKINRTYNIPPISSVYGMLKSLYGEDINNFILGYTIEHKGIQREIIRVYKEVNTREYTLKDSRRFKDEPVYLEYLIDPKLIIYTNIDKERKLNDVLNLGRTDCLAKVNIDTVELTKQEGVGYNQYTNINVGSGFIKRINTLTKYNEQKGYYEYKGDIFRENEEFEYDGYYDNEEEQSIFLWEWKDGEVNEFK